MNTKRLDNIISESIRKILKENNKEEAFASNIVSVNDKAVNAGAQQAISNNLSNQDTYKEFYEKIVSMYGEEFAIGIFTYTKYYPQLVRRVLTYILNNEEEVKEAIEFTNNYEALFNVFLIKSDKEGGSLTIDEIFEALGVSKTEPEVERPICVQAFALQGSGVDRPYFDKGYGWRFKPGQEFYQFIKGLGLFEPFGSVFEQSNGKIENCFFVKQPNRNNKKQYSIQLVYFITENEDTDVYGTLMNILNNEEKQLTEFADDELLKLINSAREVIDRTLSNPKGTFRWTEEEYLNYIRSISTEHERNDKFNFYYTDNDNKK